MAPLSVERPAAPTLEQGMTTLTQEQALHANFSQGLMLPDDCVAWLMEVWHAIQTLDDYADGDAVSREDLDDLIWRVLVQMPGNPWFLKHATQVLPAMATMVLKWQASDRFEREGHADARSFVWRAGYYDLVLMAVLLCHGAQAASKVGHIVMQLYGESFEDYLAEFKGGKHA
jgi:hypothetical protein